MNDEKKTGTVTSFNPKKRYGFLAPGGGGNPIFLHISAVERAGMKTLNPGQKIHYEVSFENGEQNLIILGLAD